MLTLICGCADIKSLLLDLRSVLKRCPRELATFVATFDRLRVLEEKFERTSLFLLVFFVLAQSESNVIALLSDFMGERGKKKFGNYGSYGNVAIKQVQRLLADYAEREQRKDCEAGLIMGV